MPNTPIKKHVVAGVWAGYYTTHTLPIELYKKTGKKMVKAVKAGYVSTVKFGVTDHAMVKELTDNVWFFSAAKTYQNVRGMQAAKEALKKVSTAFYDEDGDTITPYVAFRDGYYKKNGDFVEGASQIFDTYNEAWLQTEYSTVIAMAQSASRWMNIQRNIKTLPYLRFNAVEDAVECPMCAEYDGITLPATDDFWSTNMPGAIHWNCRCTVTQLDEEDVDDISSDDEVSAAIKNADDHGRQDMFRMNPGKDKVIFQTEGPNKHPYFSVAAKDKDLLNNNFNLPKQ